MLQFVDYKSKKYEFLSISSISGKNIMKFSEGNRLMGLVDIFGNIIVPCEYESISDFSEGLIAVKRNGLWGYINEKGEEIIPCTFDCYDNPGNFHNGFAVLHLKDGYGFIDKTGKFTSCSDKIKSPFDNHLAVISKFVKENGVQKQKHGYINDKGETLIPCKYHNATSLNTDGFGRIYKEYKREEVHTDTGIAYKVKSYVGLVNSLGEIILPCDKYSYIDDYVDNMCIVKNINGLFGYINKEFKEIIPCQYRQATSFKNGLALVSKSKKEWYIINTSGETIAKSQKKYDIVRAFNEGLAIVTKDWGYGCINSKGEEVLPCEYDWMDDFCNGLSRVERNGLWGYINEKGEEILPIKYDRITTFNSDGFSMLKKMNTYTIIDRNGNIIFSITLENNRSYVQIISGGYLVIYHRGYEEYEEYEEIMDINNKCVIFSNNLYCSALNLKDKSIYLIAHSFEELTRKKVELLKLLKEDIQPISKEQYEEKLSLIRGLQEELQSYELVEDLNESINDSLLELYKSHTLNSQNNDEKKLKKVRKDVL